MGFFDDDEFETLLAESNKFKPQELNEANVQAIFHRCLKKEDAKEVVRTALFTTLLGYTDEEEIVIAFDKEALRKNEKNIRYLYGQLKSTHTAENEAKRHSVDDFRTTYMDTIWVQRKSAENEAKRHSVDDFRTTYMDTIWVQRKSAVHELLYLGGNSVLGLLSPFSKRQNDTAVISNDIKPTLSPKDPAFPAWWEEHKGEWED